jgi:hypothetical protein
VCGLGEGADAGGRPIGAPEQAPPQRRRIVQVHIRDVRAGVVPPDVGLVRDGRRWLIRRMRIDNAWFTGDPAAIFGT